MIGWRVEPPGDESPPQRCLFCAKAVVPPNLANLPKQTFRIMVSANIDSLGATPRPVCCAATNTPTPDLRTRHDPISAHHDPRQFAGGHHRLLRGARPVRNPPPSGREGPLHQRIPRRL